MKRQLSDYAVEQDERATAEIGEHLEDIVHHRGQYYPRDIKRVADPLGAKAPTISERINRRPDWTIGEVIALGRAGLLPADLRNHIVEELTGETPAASASASSREVSLAYDRARNAILVTDGEREIGVARFRTRLSDASTKLVRGICKIAGVQR